MVYLHFRLQQAGNPLLEEIVYKTLKNNCKVFTFNIKSVIINAISIGVGCNELFGKD